VSLRFRALIPNLAIESARRLKRPESSAVMLTLSGTGWVMVLHLEAFCCVALFADHMLFLVHVISVQCVFAPFSLPVLFQILS